MSAPFFRKARSQGPVLSSEQSARQGSVVRSAAAALPDTEAVRSFLNSYHSELKARPLDLAVTSDAGLKAVNAALALVSAATARLSGASA